MEREKIIQALETIQEVCEENRCCTECPLRGENRDGYVTCSIKNHIPKNWAINNHKPWKAFEW